MWKVFSVKTIYRILASGKPKITDENYREDLDLIQERIVTIKARNFDEAISIGEKEAIKYASETEYLNPYGQSIRQEYIGSIDAFEPFESISANVEVFSTTYLIESSINNDEITDNIMGKFYQNDKKIRTKFINSEFSGFIKKS